MSGLDRLRTHLNLTKFGRLTDDWDQQFGYRRIERANGQYTKIDLFRESDGSWLVDASTSGSDVSTEEIALLRAELVQGIAAAGYQATPRTKPNYGPKS